MNDNFKNEVYISVDVETAGPFPGKYSLLSIGACVVDKQEHTFYIELKPTSRVFTNDALRIHNLDMTKLLQTGIDPKQAMAKFAEWVQAVVPFGSIPVLVAFNAAFDWMFINFYFHQYLGENPFGHTALDIKSYYMGLTGCTWQETSMNYIGRKYIQIQSLSHHALDDALDQARIFAAMLCEKNKKKGNDNS